MSQFLKGQDQLDKILDRKSTARLIGICLTTLSRLDIPRIRIRRRIFYKRSVVLEYLESKTEIMAKEN
jgi:hypothetical protein